MTRDIPPFEGFPADLPDFLWGLALNNEKPWFEAHKQDYERCLHEPLLALTANLQKQMTDRFGHADQLHISRIYRDARRLYGRGPYNDHLWFSIGESRQLYDGSPKFWFGISANRCDWGMGMWCAGTDVMERWRKRIDEHPEKLTAIVKKIGKLPGFTTDGDIYKRPKGDPGALLYNWYNMKMPSVIKEVSFDPNPPGAELLQTLFEDFSALMPLYDYMHGVWSSGE